MIEKIGFGRMSSGKRPPAKKVRIVIKINLGAQTSGLQKPINPKSKFIKKQSSKARRAAKRESSRVSIFVWKNMGGRKSKYRIVSSPNEKKIFIALSPASRAKW